jgi:hypothetical protein
MSKAVAKVAAQEVAPEAPANEQAALISMIERAARDPSVDISKMERLFEMHQKVQSEMSRRSFLAAFAEMQPHLPTVARDGKIEIPAKGEKAPAQKPTAYARWEDIDEAARPVYSAHGFSLTFDIEQTPERITAIAVLGHKDGHERRVPFSSPIESSGFKNNTQGWGSALSYCKRYAACAALNIITRGQDDDGKAAGAPPPITEEQAVILRDWLEGTQSEEKAFLAHFKAESIATFPADKFEEAVTAFKKKAGRK